MPTLPRVLKIGGPVGTLGRQVVLSGGARLRSIPIPAYRGPLAFCMGAGNDHTVSMPFLNLMELARPWYDPDDGLSRAASGRRLFDEGALDSNYWPMDPTKMEEGRAQTVFGYSGIGGGDYRQGDYLLTWDGTCTVDASGGVSNVQFPGGNAMTFTYNGTSNLQITVSEFSAFDNPRNLILTRPDRRALYDAGERFNPDYIEVMSHFDIDNLRFMNWQETNDSLTPWNSLSELPAAGDMRFRPQPRGISPVPLQRMIELCHRLDCDPWFCIPLLATDNFVTEFCVYVRDNLDPSRKVRIEYSNEMWNSAFDLQWDWLADQAQALWGESGATARRSYGAYRARQVAMLARAVFTGEHESRLITVLGSQVSTPATTSVFMYAPTWESNDPEGYVAPHTAFDEVSVTTYFGSLVASNIGRQAEVMQADDEEGEAAAFQVIHDYAFGQQTDRFGFWAEHAALAAAEGLGLSAYEGGQHVHHSAQVSFPRETLDGDGETTAFLFPSIRPPDSYFVLRVRANFDDGEGWQDLGAEDYDYALNGGDVEITYPKEGSPLAVGQRLRVENVYATGREAHIDGLLSGFVRSQLCADLYERSWNYWPTITSAPWMHFTDFSHVSIFGSWGLFVSYDDFTDPPPRTAFLMQAAAKDD